MRVSTPNIELFQQLKNSYDSFDYLGQNELFDLIKQDERLKNEYAMLNLSSYIKTPGLNLVRKPNKDEVELINAEIDPLKKAADNIRNKKNNSSHEIVSLDNYWEDPNFASLYGGTKTLPDNRYYCDDDEQWYIILTEDETKDLQKTILDKKVGNTIGTLASLKEGDEISVDFQNLVNELNKLPTNNCVHNRTYEEVDQYGTSETKSDNTAAPFFKEKGELQTLANEQRVINKLLDGIKLKLSEMGCDSITEDQIKGYFKNKGIGKFNMLVKGVMDNGGPDSFKDWKDLSKLEAFKDLCKIIANVFLKEGNEYIRNVGNESKTFAEMIRKQNEQTQESGASPINN